MKLLLTSKRTNVYEAPKSTSPMSKCETAELLSHFTSEYLSETESKLSEF